jgi:hypothetical protein
LFCQPSCLSRSAIQLVGQLDGMIDEFETGRAHGKLSNTFDLRTLAAGNLELNQNETDWLAWPAMMRRGLHGYAPLEFR